jgi:hypothetical protein
VEATSRGARLGQSGVANGGGGAAGSCGMGGGREG